MRRRGVAFVLLAAGAVAFPAPFAFVLPGLAVALLANDERPWSLAPVLSLAFWPVALQPLLWAHAPVRPVAAALLVASAAVVAWRATAPGPDRFVAGVLGAAVLFRLVPAAYLPAASGVDQSFHTFVVGRILAVGGVPESVYPLAEGSMRGLPVGFHFLCAALGLGANAATLWASVACYAALTLAVYRGLACWWSPRASALAAILVCFLANKPQTLPRYGASPLCMSIALTVAAVALWAGGMRTRVRWMPIAVLGAGALIAHPTPVYGALFLLVPAAVVSAARHVTRERLVATAVAAGAALALSLPTIVVALARPVPPETVEWTRTYLQRTCVHLYEARGIEWPAALVTGVIDEHGAQFSWLVGLALAYALWRRRWLAAWMGALLAGLALVALNLKLWVLPFSVLLYPDRMVILAFLAPAPIIAAALDDAPARFWSRRWALVAVTALVAAFAGWKGTGRYLSVFHRYCAVTRDDFAAADWLRRNTPPEAVVMVMREDSGLWVPAFAERRITRPQGAPTYFRQPEWPPPTYLYIGRAALVRDPVQALAAEGVKAVPVKVFEKGRTRIYALGK